MCNVGRDVPNLSVYYIIYYIYYNILAGRLSGSGIPGIAQIYSVPVRHVICLISSIGTRS